MNILALHLGHDGSVTVIEGDEIIIHHQLDRFNKFKHEFAPSFELFFLFQDLKIKFDKVVITSMGTRNLPIKYFLKKFFNVKDVDIISIDQTQHHIFHAKCARHFFNDPEETVYFIADGDGAIDFLKHKDKFIDNLEVIENESVYDEKMNILHKYYGSHQQVNIRSDKLTVSQNIGLGKAYQKLTYELGLEEFEEGKAMALSSYGKFKDSIANTLIFNNQWNLNIMNRLNENYDMENKYNRFMLDPTIDHTSKDSKSLDFVKTFQFVFQHVFFNQIKKIQHPYKNIILSGGCAQNVLNNTFLKQSLDKNVLADPYNGDFGISLGAALHFTDNKVKPLKHICSGFTPDFNLNLFESKKTNPKEVAKILKKEPIAIFSGKSEQGQRGLGFRSLLANPMQKGILNKINKIKKREWYRPFACTVIEEEAHKYFDINQGESSPYMMFVYKCKNKNLDTVCSVDGFSRIQTLNKTFHPKFYQLIKEFKKIAFVPVVLNTSLNLPGRVLCEDSNDLLYLMENSNLKYCYLSDQDRLIWLK